MKTLIKLFKLFRHFLYFKSKVTEAYLSYRIEGKRYYVLPLIGTNKMIVVSEQYKHKYNAIAKKRNLRSIDHRDILRTALYATPQDGITRKSIKVK